LERNERGQQRTHLNYSNFLENSQICSNSNWKISSNIPGVSQYFGDFGELKSKLNERSKCWVSHFGIGSDGELENQLNYIQLLTKIPMTMYWKF